MSNYIEPKTEDLPRILAEAMGWELCDNGWSRKTWVDSDLQHAGIPGKFKPHLSHDHAQLAVEECFKRGLLIAYYRSLISDDPPSHTVRTLLATPEQKSRAALRALTEGKQ